MKYEYRIQHKWRGTSRWETSGVHYTSMSKAEHYLKCHTENAKCYKSRIAKRAVGKWEVVK